MKNYILVIIISFLFSGTGWGQYIQSPVVSKSYQQEPRDYVSFVHDKYLETNILIDRAPYPPAIHNINGYDRVTVLNTSEYLSIMDAITLGHYEYEDKDISLNLYKRAIKLKDSLKAHLISILDYKFEYIDKEVLESSDLYQDDKGLHPQNNDIEFKKGELFASSTLPGDIGGDVVTFVFPREFVLSNQNEQEIQSIEVDFGTGEGFQQVSIDEKFQVNFSRQESRFIEVIVKLNYTKGGEFESKYSHFTVYRKGSDIVPIPNKVGNAVLNRSVPDEDFFDCYTRHSRGCELEYSILFATGQNESKLRRPFIITDGFDPNDLRDYSSNNVQDDPGLLKGADKRGLYEFVNGNPSIFETEPSANFVSKLHSNGFDIVIVNFKNGAGDIIDKGELFRSFLNEIINDDLRDNKTEQNIIVGPSMGGLITRYALAKMEQQNEDHYVKTWIAFDSPMKGASVILAMQHTVDFFSDINTYGIPPYVQFEIRMQNAANKLRSDAARQLLIYHWESTGTSGFQDNMRSNMDVTMNNLGYPDFLKRYSISNGGTSKLYPNQEQILAFVLATSPWTYAWGIGHYNDNAASPSKNLLNASKQGFLNDINLYTNYHIGYDNGPGGYITPLYSLNGQTFNVERKDADDPDDIQYIKSTFMPTASVFGLAMTKNNIYDTWEDLQNNSNIPFDEFWGMDGDSEEHVNISIATSNRVIDELKEDFNVGIHPFPRSGVNQDQTIGGPVAYTFKDKVSFGGNGNSFTFEDGADARIRATDLIKFESGFVVKQGAIINANTEPVNYSTVFRSNKYLTNSRDLTVESQSRGDIYDYSDRVSDRLISENLKIQFYPNPANNYINLNYNSTKIKDVNIYDVNGKQIKYFADADQKLNISDLLPGMYFIKAIVVDGRQLNGRFTKKLKNENDILISSNFSNC